MQFSTPSPVHRGLRRLLPAALLSVALLPGCRSEAPAPSPASSAEPTPAPRETTGAPDPVAPVVVAEPGNLLTNAGFEQGDLGWRAMPGNRNWGEFLIAEAPVRTGARSAHLPVSWPAGQPGQSVKVYGVIQEPTDQRFPERLSGWYRVESWERGDPATDLYLQVVVIVWGDPRTHEIIGTDPQRGIKNYQVRYYLAGLRKPPFALQNARLRFVSRGDPPLGEWVRFDIPVREDFQAAWGVVPEGYEFVRVLFEARWDNKPEGVPVRADVYYDDLFLGHADQP